MTSRIESLSSAERGASLLTQIVRELVDEPTAVEVTAVEGVQCVVFEIKVGKPDVKRIIGRQGRTANAVREIMTNIGAKQKRRFRVEVVEPSPDSHRARLGSIDFRVRHED